MVRRVLLFLVWALALGSAVAWGLRLYAATAPVPARAQVATAAPVARGDLTRLLGVDAPPPLAVAAAPAPDARFHLVGVVAPRPSQAAREGVAVIAVDGAPAKAFRVGAVVDGDNVLKSVGARGAMLGPRDGAALVALNLSPPVPAATGSLPPPPGFTPPVMPQAMPQAMPQGRPLRPPMPRQGAGLVPAQAPTRNGGVSPQQ